MTRREDEWKDKPTNPREVVSTQWWDAEGLPGREGTGWRHRGMTGLGVDCRCGEEGLGMARVAMGVAAVAAVRGDLEGKIGAEDKLSSCPKGLWDLKLEGGSGWGPLPWAHVQCGAHHFVVGSPWLSSLWSFRVADLLRWMASSLGGREPFLEGVA